MNKSQIIIKKMGITELDVDAIVNAANEGLWAGGGVCGAIFRDAGMAQLTEACDRIGGCKTGEAVITPGFNLPARCIIHAVGPVWQGGNSDEPMLLYNAYKNSLLLAKAHDMHSIAFPLISAGIYGYPKEKAWEIAIHACKDFINENEDYEIEITFAVLEDVILNMGMEILNEVSDNE